MRWNCFHPFAIYLYSCIWKTTLWKCWNILANVERFFQVWLFSLTFFCTTAEQHHSATSSYCCSAYGEFYTLSTRKCFSSQRMSNQIDKKWARLTKPSGTERNLLSSINCAYRLSWDIITNWSSVLMCYDSSLIRCLLWTDSILEENVVLPWLVSYKNSESSHVIIWSVYTGRTTFSGPICWHLAPLLLKNQRIGSAWFLARMPSMDQYKGAPWQENCFLRSHSSTTYNHIYSFRVFFF